MDAPRVVAPGRGAARARRGARARRAARAAGVARARAPRAAAGWAAPRCRARSMEVARIVGLGVRLPLIRTDDYITYILLFRNFVGEGTIIMGKTRFRKSYVESAIQRKVFY